MDGARRKGGALRLDSCRFETVERLATYGIVNNVLLAQMELQQACGLRAEPFQVFLMIAIATAQRHVRGAVTDADALVDKTPLPPEEAGSISRRRIAEALGIPLETVRRHVAALIAAGLVVERGRGRIATPGGTLARISAMGTTQKLARQQLALANLLLRLGVFSDGAEHPGTVQGSDAAPSDSERDAGRRAPAAPKA